MSTLTWDKTGERQFETGVDRGVLYIPNDNGVYDTGVAWNGLTKVDEKPVGGTPTALYADNIKYLQLMATEYFEADISAYTYPDEFAACNGEVEPEAGVAIGQQPRQPFGVCYRTQIGNDLNGQAGYKLHLVYGALAAPSQVSYSTINDTPAAIEFTWSITTTPVAVTNQQPTATITVDSTTVEAAALSTLEGFLYGTEGTDPSLPTPDAVLAIFSGTVTAVTPVVPTYNGTTHVITIPSVTGLTYYIDDEAVTGTVTITANTVVTCAPNQGYVLAPDTVDEWLITF